jgi:4'-phosphopantetheinyl transferase
MQNGPTRVTADVLDTGAIALVRARILDPGVPLHHLERVLSSEERERADRFRFEEDRLRTRIAWGLLRCLLGRLLAREPASFRFDRTEDGKPFLEGGPSFNIAHSGPWVLIGVAAGGRLGVDVEVPRPIRDLDSLIRTVFSTEEIAELETYPATERAQTFFRGWTRKEAYLKGVGGGLTIPLKTISVSLARDPGNVLLRADTGSDGGSEFWVRSLLDIPDAEAALAWDRPWAGIRWIEPGELHSS